MCIRDSYRNVVLEVPKEAREAYQNDINWSLFYQIYPVAVSYTHLKRMPRKINRAPTNIIIT